eukprot:scaffold26985_cov27-Prasinocladus_malaysianus.AAC.1
MSLKVGESGGCRGKCANNDKYITQRFMPYKSTQPYDGAVKTEEAFKPAIGIANSCRYECEYENLSQLQSPLEYSYGYRTRSRLSTIDNNRHDQSTMKVPR